MTEVMNAGIRFGEWTNQTLKTAMGKSLDWYQEGWENNLKITETPPDVVEIVKPDQNTFEYYLQAQTEKDVEVFKQVRLNMDKAQEKQKESYRSRVFRSLSSTLFPLTLLLFSRS
ncbi:uncharacterized protein ACWYII_001668 isoform 4-T16 [Salvelinus alpinus]